jgi:hypothetical protein
MNLKSVFIVLVALVAGIVGGALAYQVAVPAGNAAPPATKSIVLKSPDGAKQAQRAARFAPCKAPAKLEGRRCVTDVVRTVVVPGSAPVSAPSSRSAAPSTPAPAPASSSGSQWNDDGRHGGESEADHHGDDDDDDDHHGGGDDDSHTGTHTGTGTQTRTRSHD